jgi:hypothetical protein
VVLGTMALIFAPFIMVDGTQFPSTLFQVFHRMFPFARGLYEDKVGNIWCATSILIKWHIWFPKEFMMKFALGWTILALLPSCVHVFLYPSRISFLYTLAGSALSFFLFSFQVHEKSFLLPLLPIILLSSHHPLLSSWCGSIATFSMFPLLYKDGQMMNYIILQIFFIIWSMQFARSQQREGTTTDSISSVTSGEKKKLLVVSKLNIIAMRITHRFNQHTKLMFPAVQVSYSSSSSFLIMARMTVAAH